MDLAGLAEQLASLCSMVTRAGNSLEPRIIADMSLEYVLDLLGLEAGAFFLLDEKTGHLHLQAQRRLPEKFSRGAPKLTIAEAGEFGLGARMPLRQTDDDGLIRGESVSQHPRLARLLSERPELKVSINIPLIIADQWLGNLLVFSPGQPLVRAEQVALLDIAARQIATLVRQAQLLAAERRQRRLAETLQQVANALVTNLDQEKTLPDILEHLSRVMEYDGAAVLLLQGELLKTVAARGFGGDVAVRQILQVSLKPEEHPYLRRIIREGKPFRFPPEHRQDPFRGILAMETVHSTMAAPLKAKGKVIGVLTVHKIDPNWYDDVDLAALEAFGSHAALAIQNAELWTGLQQRSQELNALSAQSVEALERERQRISRELHDEVGQALTMTRISLEMALRDVPAELTAVRSRLEEAITLTTQMLNDVRRLAYDLRPTVLDDLGLVSALHWYADTFSQRTELAVRFSADNLPERPPADVETVLYRLVQEGLTNIARHADARQVEIELTGEPQAICLRIRDDGRGFDAARLSKPWSPGQGLGLRGMRERVKLLGGKLDVDSKPGKGTELRAWVPWNRDKRET